VTLLVLVAAFIMFATEGLHKLPTAATALAAFFVLAACGVDTTGVLRVEGYQTPTKIRILGGGPYSLKHQVARYDIEDQLPAGGPWLELVLERLDRLAPEAQAVALSDYGYGTVADEAVRRLAAGGRRPRWTCADSRSRIAEFTGVDGVTPNLQELEGTAGRSLDSDAAVAAAAEALRSRLGARFVLATRGNRGMTLVENGQPALHIPVHGADEVADVTGAGDTVLAVLTAALAAGATPAEAARLANYGGGVVVMKLGTATVSRHELELAIERDRGATGP
jgi:rfaE bifunctional protein kinase chain/domain